MIMIGKEEVIFQNFFRLGKMKFLKENVDLIVIFNVQA